MMILFLLNFSAFKLKLKIEKTKRWTYTQPGQVAIFGLPAPLSVETIMPTILSAPKTVIHERAILGLIEWIALIPNPISIKHITAITTFIKKSQAYTQIGCCCFWWWWYWWKTKPCDSSINSVVIHVIEATNEEKADKEEAKNTHRRLKRVKALEFLEEIKVGHCVFWVLWSCALCHLSVG